MIKNNTPFNSESEVEDWITVNLNDGVSDEDLLNFLIQKKEELRSNCDFYLKTRRLALVTGDKETATKLHNLFKAAETELASINKVLLNSFYITTNRTRAKSFKQEEKTSVFQNKEDKQP